MVLVPHARRLKYLGTHCIVDSSRVLNNTHMRPMPCTLLVPSSHYYLGGRLPIDSLESIGTLPIDSLEPIKFTGHQIRLRGRSDLIVYQQDFILGTPTKKIRVGPATDRALKNPLFGEKLTFSNELTVRFCCKPCFVTDW